MSLVALTTFIVVTTASGDDPEDLSPNRFQNGKYDTPINHPVSNKDRNITICFNSLVMWNILIAKVWMQNTIYIDTMTVVEKKLTTKLNFNEKYFFFKKLKSY